MSASKHKGLAMVVGALMFASIAGAFYAWSRRTPTQPPRDVRDAAPSADARVDSPNADAAVPATMVAIAGATFETGFRKPATFLAWCASVERDPKFCDELVRRAEALHRTTDVAAFLIDRGEVTRGQFAAWLSDELARGGASIKRDVILDGHGEPLAFPACDAVSGMKIAAGGVQVDGSPNVAVVCVTFAAAAAYCEAHQERLPTLGEWQLTAGGVDHRVLPWGDTMPKCDTVIFGRDPKGSCAQSPEGPQSAEVAGRGDVTPEGVIGMGGNVSEWVADSSTPAGAPRHLAAGGSWTGGVADMTPAKVLLFGTPDNSFPGQATIGFRCARNAR